MSKINTTTISSLSEFIYQLETRLVDKYRITLFRGQSTDRALIPSIARHQFKKKREIDEIRMLEEFNIQSIQYLTHEPKNVYEQVTIAQHHGIPTRLLDWTENALTAAYFAVHETPKANDKSVIWIISMDRDSKYLIKDQSADFFKQTELKFFKPSSIIARVSSQLGWFSIHPYLGSGMYERADTVYDESVRINKVIISPDKVKEVFDTLEHCGINKHSIYRDLDSLGAYIFDKYRFNSNMLKKTKADAN